MNIPEGQKYTKEHEWIRIIEGNVALVGITDFAQQELGEIVYVEVDTVGEEIAQDDLFGTVEAVKTTSELFMPVSGKVLEFNPKLDENEDDQPELVNESPYDEAWIIKIEISDMGEYEALLDSGAYTELIS